jgi:protein-tyrosine-phosphatase
MKVLFVCRANGGRSPMAEAFFNKLSRRGRASSAGVEVAKGGEVGTPANPNNVKVMKEIGYDISKHRRKQLTRQMTSSADVIVFMASRKKLPGYLTGSKKVRFWRVLNPRGQSMATRRRIRDAIRDKVKRLAKEAG